jgi:hypothetical protein
MDWNTLVIGAIVGAVITLPIAIFGNLITPWVKSYFEKRSLSRRERRLFIILSRYKHICKLKGNRAYANLFLFKQVAYGLFFLSAQVALTSPLIISTVLTDLDSNLESINYNGLLMLFGMALSFFVGVYILWQIVDDTKSALGFDKFREKTIANLKKLDANPEELDKIDKWYAEVYPSTFQEYERSLKD